MKLALRAPFRLDLTAAVLRRLSTNVVDRFEGGVYRRLLGDPSAPVLLCATQPAPGVLDVTLAGEGAAHDGGAALAARILGTGADVEPFIVRAQPFPWLHALAVGARGVRPPRYPTLWEAAVNAIVFQQVSIHAAAAILRRVIEHTVAPVAIGGERYYAFPAPEALLAADPAALRTQGLSINKVVALAATARAILDGALDEAALDALPTPALTAALAQQKGIGPWTAAVIALRGFGRLDVFPMNDSGATRSLRQFSGDDGVAAEPILAALGDRRGLLYYHLLLGRLAARGEVVLGTPESTATAGGS